MTGKERTDGAPRFLLGIIIVVALVIGVWLLVATVSGTPSPVPQRHIKAQPLMQPPLEPIQYPLQRDALTDLNPLYVPFFIAETGWTPRIATSYAQDGGNADWLPACDPPTVTVKCCETAAKACTWTIIPADTSGVVTRIFLGMPLAEQGDVVTDVQVFLYTPATATQPLETIDVNNLITRTDYPLVVDGKYSSGGVVLYKPFLFDGGLRVESSGVKKAYFQLNYYETATPLSDTNGWLEVADFTTLWQPGDMGKPVDQLSLTSTQLFTGVVATTRSVILAPGLTEPVFTDTGSGTIVKIAFPASLITPTEEYPPDARSPLPGIHLRVRYSDTAVVSVDLPLDLVFLSPEADYTPDPPPTQDLDALVFAATGKHVIVKDDTAWVLEPVGYDLYLQEMGAYTTNAGAIWYQVGLDKLLDSSGALTATPPITGIEAYSLRSLRDISDTIVPLGQGEGVVQGPDVWFREHGQASWAPYTLDESWGSQPNHPPTDTIDYQTFSYDRGLTPTLDQWVIRDDPPGQEKYWYSYIAAPPIPPPDSWQSGDLVSLWPFYAGQRVDAFTISPFGDIVVLENLYWFCPAERDCSTEGWDGPHPLSDAWWMDRWPDGSDRLYGKGSLFFGYNESADAYYLTFPMPYREGIEVTLFNSGTHGITLTTVISYTPQTYGPGSGYLDIRYVQGDQRSGAFLGDWPNQVLSTTLRGRGKLVGVVRTAKGQIEHCWGRTFLESDELIVVDRAGIDCEQVGAELVCDCEDQGAYVQCGTGMEEFSNGGFYFIHGPFYLPTHGVPLSPPNLLHLPPGPTATCTNRSDSYPLKYKGEVSEREGEDYVETEAIMYRFLLNEAIRFDRSLIVGQEFYFCPDPGSGTTIWGQTDSECRHGMTQTLGLMTIAYIAPNDVFLPVVMKNHPQEIPLSPPSPPGGYPPPPSPTPPPTPTPGGGYPPPPTPTPTPTPDQEAPVSSVDPLPPYQGVLSFTVSWSGSDSGGSGLASYDLQYRDGLVNPWTDWLTYTTATSGTFGGASSHSYYFRSRARDHAGNLEDWPANPDYDTFTTIDTQPPSTTVEAMDLYTTSTSFPVRWYGSDDLSGLHHYDLYYRDEAEAFWQPWLQGITTTQASFTGTAGHTNHFCSRGVDQVGNVEPECPPISVGGEWPIQSDAQIGVTPWSRVDALPAYTAETRFTVSWSGSPDVETYDVQVRDGQFGLWQAWLNQTSKTSAQFNGQYGHIYYFRCRGTEGPVQEVYPYDYDTYTKLESPAAGGGPSAPPGGISSMPPDEAPDRMEEITRTHPIGVPLLGYIAPEGDVDWYRFELTETLRLRVTLYNLPADFDIYVFDGPGEFLWASTRGYDQYERVVAQIPAGVYYVRLDGYAGAWSQEASYYLLVEEVE